MYNHVSLWVITYGTSMTTQRNPSIYAFLWGSKKRRDYTFRRQFNFLGGNAQTFLALQEVINNLMISAIQYRSETDSDIRPHVHQRCVEERVVQPSREVDYCKQTLIHVIQDVLTSLSKMQVGFHGSFKAVAHVAYEQECRCTVVCLLLASSTPFVHEQASLKPYVLARQHV